MSRQGDSFFLHDSHILTTFGAKVSGMPSHRHLINLLAQTLAEVNDAPEAYEKYFGIGLDGEYHERQQSEDSTVRNASSGLGRVQLQLIERIKGNDGVITVGMIGGRKETENACLALQTRGIVEPTKYAGYRFTRVGWRVAAKVASS